MNYSFSVFIEKTQRVDIYLSALFWELSRSYIQKLIDTWSVKVNGKIIKKNLKIHCQDELFIQEIVTQSNIIPQNIPLDIIYENRDICVINKDAWINVHPTPWIEGKKGTLVNALMYHCNEELPIISGQERPGIVHRLDKDTSWVIITAKNDRSMKEIAEKIKNREVKKYYIAIVWGILSEKKFQISSHIWRHQKDSTKMTVKNPLNPKAALSSGEVLWYIDERYTVLRIDLHTWRTHQIRVHLASIWYPILWDAVYGNAELNKQALIQYDIKRQMLHAEELCIELQWKLHTFIAPVKADMRELLKKIAV